VLALKAIARLLGRILAPPPATSYGLLVCRVRWDGDRSRTQVIPLRELRG